MKIIDAHTHLGSSRVTGFKIDEKGILDTMERYHLDGVLSYPLPEAYPDFKTAHDRIYRFAQDHPKKVWGVVDVNPRVDEDEYFTEVSRCVKELGFVAIKLHPFLESTMPNGPHAVKVYEAARELKVPVIVHTGNGVPLALPSQIIRVAMKWPDVTFVLAHAGSFMYFDEALLAAELCDNIFLELSSTGAHHLEMGLGSIGTRRMMFGSDGPIYVLPELAKCDALDMSQEDREWYLGRTAIELYGLDA